MSNLVSRLKYLDVPLFVVMLLLQALGLAVLYSTSLSNTSLTIFWRQVFFSTCGLILFFVFSFYNYHSLVRINRIVYPVTIALLVFVLLFGEDIRGSSRWITLGFFNLQPAEFAKIALVMVLARWFSLRQHLVNSWRHFIVTLSLSLLPAILILREPDLGSSLVLGAAWFGMLLISPISKKFLLILGISCLVVGVFSWEYVLYDYQRERVQVFFNSELDPKGKGYNVRQATIAVGSGQVFGRGLGKGLQSHLKFLPERQTDFIFASAAEEIGLFGAGVLVTLYGFLLFRISAIAKASKDYLGRFVAVGFFSVFFLQIVVNIGMNMGIMPVTGIPLPMLSYGGSALFVAYIALGIVQNVYIQSKALRF